MSPPDVKFCGLTRAEDARLARELAADYLGVIFAGGPRLVTAAHARVVFAGTGQSGDDRTGRVGVFGASEPDSIASKALEAGLTVAQLHADPDAGMVEAVRRRFGGNVWAVLRVEGARLDRARMASLLEAADAVVLDARVEGRLGGTGTTLEWEALRGEVDAARDLARGVGRVVLAGGLTPENVARAVRDLAPDVVDVSSGVEGAPGIKDHDRMRAFHDAARNA